MTTDKREQGSPDPILPPAFVALGSFWLGAKLALESDNPSMFYRFMAVLGVLVGLIVLVYLGRSRR